MPYKYWFHPSTFEGQFLILFTEDHDTFYVGWRPGHGLVSLWPRFDFETLCKVTQLIEALGQGHCPRYLFNARGVEKITGYPFYVIERQDGRCFIVMQNNESKEFIIFQTKLYVLPVCISDNMCARLCRVMPEIKQHRADEQSGKTETPTYVIRQRDYYDESGACPVCDRDDTCPVCTRTKRVRRLCTDDTYRGWY